MKLLQNPWVTGSLVVVALVVAAYQFIPAGGLHFNRSNPQSGSANSAQPQSQPKSTASREQHQTAVAPSQAAVGSERALPAQIDRQYVESHFPSWVNSPIRDPFLLVDTTKDNSLPAGETNSPVATWKLNGIWHQDLSELAIINNRIYREGDEVAKGYTLEKIEGDEVWFQGPNRRERLGFQGLGRITGANSTNQAPESVEQKKIR